ncbi:hypothetical protein DV735_g4306, partial [Chaetothyriales sp. CBS 134920]
MVDKPLLPPRQPRTTSVTPQHATTTTTLSPYSSDCFNDGRASSQQSLYPVFSIEENDGTPRTSKRTVLLVYIHGFLGDETSFQSFPAHVHNLLAMLLADTHVVHSKIYPRYLSRNKIEVARDDFSRWLTPHESPETDIVLLGHSLGGILAAEVVLKKNPAHPQQFLHKILGLIAFDSPFLGIHPSVIGTGIASLFRGTPTTNPAAPSDGISSSATANEATSSTTTTISSSSDQTFNPAFANDVHLPRRTGMLSRALYFVNKHWGSVNTAMCDYIDSHFEHGGVLADYPGLRRRYNAVRALEDIDPFSSPSRRRVRFANYYSAMTAHTSMFSMSEEAYAQLVGDTAARIEAWVREDEGAIAAVAVAAGRQ